MHCIRNNRIADLVLLAVPLLIAGCQARNEYVPPPPPEVTVAQPVQREIVDYIETTGTTAASATVELRSRVTGYLQEIHFEDGAIVREGDLLFVLEKAPFEAALQMANAALQKANASLELAKAQFARTEELHKRNAVSTSELDVTRADALSAQADVAAAEAQVRQANLDLSYTEIRAPFFGRIGRRLVDTGNLVQAESTHLATIEQFQPIYVYFYISESEFLRLRPKDRFTNPNGSAGTLAERSAGTLAQRLPVSLGLANEEGFPYEGHIDFRAPSVDAETGTILHRGVFANEDQALLPGLFANIRVPVSEPTPRVLVESRAIATDQRGDYVLVVGEDDTVEYRPVSLGIRTGELRVVEEGLEMNEWIVVNGLQRARPGAKVVPIRAPENAPAEQVSQTPPQLSRQVSLDASDSESAHNDRASASPAL